MSESIKVPNLHWTRPSFLNLRKYDSRSVKTFLLLFLTISTAFLTVWQTSLYFGAVIENDKQRLALQEATVHAADLLARTLKTYSADLKILVLGQDLKRLVNGDTRAQRDVTRDFEILASQKPDILQIRYIDKDGNEIIRIDRHDRDVRIVGDNLLQNKADRYYFQQAVAIRDNGIYVSPIDLNVEHGFIEEPWRPVLRLAAPLTAADSSNAGIVVINIAAAPLIANLERVRPAGTAPIQMLNEGGYWLAGVPVERLWGFMFDRKTSLALEAPDVWQRIVAGYHGAFDIAGTHYVFQTLNPGLTIARNAGTPDARRSGIEWTILTTVPSVTLTGMWTGEQLPTVAAGLLVAALISLGWTHAMTARRTAEATTRDTTAELLRIERLAGLGSLVAGVAHELNTPIGNAVTVASTLSESAKQFRTVVESGQVRRATIDEFLTGMGEGTSIVLRSLERAINLIGHFKQVAVDQTSEQRRTFLIADIVADVTSTLHSRFRNGNVSLETAITATEPLDGYPGPLGQVLINLIANAHIHGFDDGGAGSITISAQDLEDDMVEIVVQDTGKGIPRESLGRIFEPFFTTRLGQDGTGLGLSIVFNIVTNVLGGTILAESETGTDSVAGSGTRMTVLIPLTAPVNTSAQRERAYNVER